MRDFFESVDLVIDIVLQLIGVFVVDGLFLVVGPRIIKYLLDVSFELVTLLVLTFLQLLLHRFQI